MFFSQIIFLSIICVVFEPAKLIMSHPVNVHVV